MIKVHRVALESESPVCCPASDITPKLRGAHLSFTMVPCHLPGYHENRLSQSGIASSWPVSDFVTRSQLASGMSGQRALLSS